MVGVVAMGVMWPGSLQGRVRDAHGSDCRGRLREHASQAGVVLRVVVVNRSAGGS